MKTIAEWNALGRRIAKGQRSAERNADGVPLFSQDQLQPAWNRGPSLAARMLNYLDDGPHVDRAAVSGFRHGSAADDLFEGERYDY